MYALINRWTTKKFLWSGILFIFIVNVFIFPFFPKLFGIMNFDAGKILDLQFGFDTVFVQNLLNNLEEKGRHVYMLSTLLIDTPYAIIYGFVYAVLINFLLRKTSVKKSFLTLFPFLISFFDVIENVFTIIFLLEYPYITSRLVPFASLVNRLKWISAGITLLTVLILLIILMYKNRQKFRFL